MPSISSQQDTEPRENHIDRAHRIQVEGAIWGGLKWTIWSAAVVTLAHKTWPLFRRQTLAIKGFLVSSAMIFGMTIGADNHLFRYEREMRIQENEVRRAARNALAVQGKIASEREIEAWRAVHEDRVRREIAERQEARRAEG